MKFVIACNIVQMSDSYHRLHVLLWLFPSHLDRSEIRFAVMDSQGFVTIWDERCLKQPFYGVDIDMQNTRGDTMQIQVNAGGDGEGNMLQSFRCKR